MSKKWQPIETAPKDGSRVLAFVPFISGYKAAHVVRWEKKASGGEGWFCDHVDLWTCKPTHWMPLPEPPKENR